MQRPQELGPECVGQLSTVQLNEVKRPNSRFLLLGGIAALIAVVVGIVVAGHLRARKPSDCDVVRALIGYNGEFTEQTKESAKANNPDLATETQYRDWAEQIKAYAAQISDPALSKKADTAAEFAAQTADLVPKYRAKPDDAGVAGQYARIGIEYANAITMLDYSCSPNG